ncbi:ABC transporter substrate-binding protein [Bifidobacterium dolichotidis]|uniref:ABC transporter substrate-binding protein n=1 Tax=Bifidobacterium dolichotidis TaxID=2306976 RepID=A0A430FKS8_9BIFI|nr:polysaccharide pyruvyl transferase family protein [Bifidobacterium dolichotidis]RSX53341.1 ABC transporter substrate-binding protein [Bifidobacterium dolichotidis]
MDVRKVLGDRMPATRRAVYGQIADLRNRMQELQRSNNELVENLRSTRRLVDSLERQQRDAKAYYLIAEAGFPNYGDELIAREWLRYLAQLHPEVPVIMDCMNAGSAAALLYNEHPHVTVVNTVARLSVENVHVDKSPDLPQEPVGPIAQHILDSLDNEGNAARVAAGIRLIQRQVRGMHVIGGGFLNSMWPANLARLAAPLWAEQHGIPAVVSGTGLMPVHEKDSAFLSQVLDAVHAFSCRDASSLDALDPQHTKAKLAPDDCFVNGLDGVYNQSADLPDVMVCVQHDLTENPQQVIETMVHTLRAWQVEPNTRVGVVECVPYEVGPVLAAVQEAGWQPVLFPMQLLLEDGFPARAGQRWFSTRYHPHLLAAAAGASGSYVVVKPGYYDVKHNAVLRMGSRWTPIAIGAQSVPEPGPGFADLQMRYKYRDEIRNNVSSLYGF